MTDPIRSRPGTTWRSRYGIAWKVLGSAILAVVLATMGCVGRQAG
jgi:hypothetical protein